MGVSGNGISALGHLKVAATGSELTTAYELDDFEAVARDYLSCIPSAFGEDFQVVFDGYAAGIEAEMVKNSAHAGAGRQLLGLPVYVNLNFVRHGLIIPRERGVSHAERSGDLPWPGLPRRE